MHIVCSSGFSCSFVVLKASGVIAENTRLPSAAVSARGFKDFEACIATV